jgi:hypothetical protein
VSRPISWMPRLHEIRRSVKGSTRSHYGRQDLEKLFCLQPRAAQKLLEGLPTVAVGTSRLVERDSLAAFLEHVHAAETPEQVAEVFEQYRTEKTNASKRRLRSLIQRNTEPVDFASLPPGMKLQRGRLEVSFSTVAELAESMYFIARALETDGDGFVRDYEPRAPLPTSRLRGELASLFADLEDLEHSRKVVAMAPALAS